MADEEKEKPEEKHEEKKPGDLPGHGKKESKLLWWGLGIAAAGLVATLLLFKSGGGSSQGGETAVNASQPFVPNPTNPFDASLNDYWPYAQQSPSPSTTTTGTTTGSTTGGTTGTSGGGKKKKGSGGKTTGGKTTGGKTTGGTTHTGGTTVTPHHTTVSPEPRIPIGTLVQPNPTANGARGWVYTTHGGEILGNLFHTWWPSQPNTNWGWNYANNAQLLASQGITKQNWNVPLKPGVKIIA